MQFKDFVLGDIEKKHLNMLNGKTETPFSDNVHLISGEPYSIARDNYQVRLDLEMQQYNNALATAITARRKRIAQEEQLKEDKKHDRRVYLPCFLLFLAAIAGLFCIVHFAMRNGIAYWAKDVIIEETSFTYFFALFYGPESAGFEVGITSIALAGCLWIALLIVGIKAKISDDLNWPLVVLIGGLFVGGFPIMVPFLAIRLLLVGLGYVAYFILTPYGLLALGGIVAILLIILGLRLKLKGFKALLAFTIIFTVAISGAFWYFSNSINDEGYDYYASQDGSSFVTAKPLDAEGSGYAFLYEGDDAFYFVISPQESGVYEISTGFGDCVSFELLNSSNKTLIQSDSDGHIRFSLRATESYYLKVVPQEYHEGHYKISCNKAT